MDINVGSLKEVFDAIRSLFSIFEKAKDAWPSGPAKDEITEKIVAAEKAFHIAEAHAAKELGYQLCRCTWPPQIMTLNDGNESVCPLCGRGGAIEPVANPAQIKTEGPVQIEAESPAKVEYEPPAPEDAVNETEAHILKIIAELGDQGYTADALAPGLNMMPIKLKYYLEKMSDKDLLHDSLAAGQKTEYRLKPKGREYLVNNNLV